MLLRRDMFISGGEEKGRRIKAPSSKDIRPTSHMLKEAIFEIIKERIKGASFLDLFAGFGSIGIEALSRGADYTLFVDKNKHAISIIYENISTAKVKDKCNILVSDSIAALEKRIKQKFDLIYIDPPYDYKYYGEVLKTIAEKETLSAEGLIIVEHYHKTEMNLPLKPLIISRREKYGQTAVTFIKWS